MSTKPRTPEHFPRMKHRAAKRVTLQARRESDRATFNSFWTALWDAFTPATKADFTLSPPPLEPTQPTTEAAPNRAASFMPGDIVTVNNPGSSLHGRVGRVRYRPTPHVARVDFEDMNSYLVRHEHLTEGEREC